MSLLTLPFVNPPLTHSFNHHIITSSSPSPSSLYCYITPPPPPSSVSRSTSRSINGSKYPRCCSIFTNATCSPPHRQSKVTTPYQAIYVPCLINEASLTNKCDLLTTTQAVKGIATPLSSYPFSCFEYTLSY